MRVGVLGGTFDPVHLGHLTIAGQAMAQVHLERVLFTPAGQPRLKEQPPVASVEDRLAMVELAVKDIPGYSVVPIEVHRAGPTYTVETLEELSNDLGPDAQLYFILGLDVLERLGEWREPERVFELCRLIAVSRPGHTNFDWPGFYTSQPHAQDRVEVVATAAVDISGTELRSRAAAGETLRGLVPDAVVDYILEHGLYRTAGA